MVALKPQRTPAGYLKLIFENIVFIWIKKNLHKMVVFVGRVISEQTGPREAKMVSLESQNIPRGPLDINI